MSSGCGFVVVVTELMRFTCLSPGEEDEMKRRRILVVDDEPVMVSLLQDLLVDAGFDVATAENGAVALAQVTSFQPHLVITDIIMPYMEGIELISLLRKSNKGVPIIAVSGNIVGMDFLKATKVLGAVATLRKPFSSQELLEAVERSLSG